MKKTITFLIPVYNEEKRLIKTLRALSTLSLPKELKLKNVIFVNDGSTDRTLSILQKAKPLLTRKLRMKQKGAEVTILSYRQNRGKGFAIKIGMQKNMSDYILFFDADMSTPLSEIKKFIPYIKKNIDVIVGTRKNGVSTVVVHQPKYRELLGRCYTKLARTLLQVSITDFTCGFKAFSYDAAKAISNQTEVNGWGYDGELLFLAQKNNFSIVEKSVVWANDPNTKVKLFKAIPETLFDIVKIYWYHEAAPRIVEITIPVPSFSLLRKRVMAIFL